MALADVQTLHGRHPDTGIEYIQTYVLTPRPVFVVTDIRDGKVADAMKKGMERLQQELAKC